MIWAPLHQGENALHSVERSTAGTRHSPGVGKRSDSCAFLDAVVGDMIVSGWWVLFVCIAKHLRTGARRTIRYEQALGSSGIRLFKSRAAPKPVELVHDRVHHRSHPDFPERV